MCDGHTTKRKPRRSDGRGPQVSPSSATGSRDVEKPFTLSIRDAAGNPVIAGLSAAVMSRGLAMRHERSFRKDGSQMLEGSHRETR
jgi:hypothetical protein